MADIKQQNDVKKENPLPQRAGAPGRGGARGGGGGGKFNNDSPQNQRPKFGGGNHQNNQQSQGGQSRGNHQQQGGNRQGGQNQMQHQQQPRDRNGMGGGQGGHDQFDDNHGNRGGRGGRGGGRGGFRGNRPDGRGGGPGHDMNDSRMGGGGERYFTEKIMSIQGPTLDLPPSEIKKELKFANNCRLYIGNVGGDITDDEVLELFKKYGETQELFINKDKMFGFIRMDYKHNADKAKAELDGHQLKGRALKIRFAPINAAIKVKNLTSCVTNELLELAFSVFGDIERAIVVVDERGNSKCEGIVEFSRKPAAGQALRRCAEGCFFLTQSLRPVIVEPLELTDEVDGLSERTVNRKSSEFFKQRQVGPRFATVNSFEFEYGSRWKQLHELFKQKEEALQRELKMEEEKLEAQMEYARYEHETEMLRKELQQRESDRERHKTEWEMKERQAEELKRRDEEMMKKHQEEMRLRIGQQEDDMRRRQTENNSFLATAQQGGQDGRQSFGSPVQGFGGAGGASIDFDALAAAVGGVTAAAVGAADFEQVGRSGVGGGSGGGRRQEPAASGWSRREGGGGRWGAPNDQEPAGGRRGGSGGPVGGGPQDFQAKRRRY